MLTELMQQVYEANMQLPAHQLVTYSWGNVSAIDRESGLMVIKPSGVAYETLRPADMVLVGPDGHYQGPLRPSSDTATHLALYQKYPELGGIVHTHSPYATAWAQAKRPIPAYGTTHADYFYGEIPCTRPLTRQEVNDDYELNTGRVIISTLENRSPVQVPAVIVAQHGPFCWGADAAEAVHNAVVLEEVARIAWLSCQLSQQPEAIPQYLQNKHFNRKHGENAYYGQK